MYNAISRQQVKPVVSPAMFIKEKALFLTRFRQAVLK
jgi:hypothetical protein